MIQPETNQDYCQEIECIYKDEHYSVRDNGAVFRHSRDGKRLRKDDNHWTFGEPNDKNYLAISSEVIHRIVATAFHGAPPTEQHIVDHIDTNRKNNRPENLRWVTKLENVLLNPITRNKIEFICGCSAEEFLANPAKFRDKFQDSNYSWMRNVTKEEGENVLKNLQALKNNNNTSSGGTLGEWLYSRDIALTEQKINEIFKQVEKKTGISRRALCLNKAKRNDYYEARIYAAKLLRSELNLSDYEIGKLIGIAASTVNLYLEVCADKYSKDYAEVGERQFKKRCEITPENFIQKNWGTQSEFPCCPKKVMSNPITEYAAQLKENAIFFQNKFYSTTVIRSAIIDRGKSLLVMYEITKKENSEKRWGIMKIYFEYEKFVHEIIPNYNGTSEHYWLIDVENHFKSIVDGSDWSPIYDSQGKEFKGDYVPL